MTLLVLARIRAVLVVCAAAMGLSGCDRDATGGKAGDAATAGSGPSTDAGSGHLAKSDAKRKTAPLPVRVHDSAERGKMQQYVQSQSAPGAVQHSFRLATGHDVDCVEVQKQLAAQVSGSRAIASPSRPPPLQRKITGMSAMMKAHPVRPAAHVATGKDENGAERKCPVGTVPVRHVPLEEVMAFKDLASFHRKATPPSRKTLRAQSYAFGATSKHEHAVFGQEDVPNHGAHAVFNIWSPSVELESTGDWGEFSLAQLWILGYGGSRAYSALQSLEAGFQVWPEKYGDSLAHLFVYSTSDGYQETGCYEPCRRFVQTSRDVIIGGALPCYSATNSEQCEVELVWWQSSDGWWLYVNEEPVGYYPASLYAADGLRDGANTIMFGGEIVDDRSQHPGRHTRTRMGSGAYPGKGYENAAYVRDIFHYDASGAARPATALYPMRDAESACYDLSPLSKDTGTWGTFFFFGGPGYGHECP